MCSMELAASSITYVAVSLALAGCSLASPSELAVDPVLLFEPAVAGEASGGLA
jgi:hypothetical protein